MKLSIETIRHDFFSDVPSYSQASIVEPGWTNSPSGTPEFVQPPLKVNDENILHTSKIWLISAPGAVGKSTFAKQLAIETKAIYIDLAKAETIGSNYLTGALFKSNLSEFMINHCVALLIDAIDEASLRVTFESRMDFYKDVVSIAKNNKFPILVFGRQASINEGHLILEEFGVTPALVSIDYFERNDAIKLVKNMVIQKINKHDINKNKIKNIEKHDDVVERTICNTLNSLDRTDSISNKNFSGYAPVLDAVAEYIYPETNFSHVERESRDIIKGDLLEKICSYILKREQNKFVNQIDFEERDCSELYSIKEQMMALCHIYAGGMIKDIKFDSHGLSEDKQQIYIKRAKEFIEQHPFLVDGKNPTNVVFAGILQAFALKYDIDCSSEIFRQHSVSPLLAEFYFKENMLFFDIEENKNESVETAHIPLLVCSYEALSGQNTTICLDISGDETSKLAEVAIIQYSADGEGQILRSFQTSSSGKLVFGKQICSLEIDCPLMEIEFYDSSMISFNIPINIDVKKISFRCPVLQFIGDGMVTITAKECFSEVGKVTRFGKVEFYAGWPGSMEYPWTFANRIETLEEHNSDNLQTALFSFCKLIRSFRSHSKGKLARFEDKIDHNRMSKNYGEEIKKYLIDKKVITHSVDTRMYYLDSDNLASIIGVSYHDVIKRNCPRRLSDILKSII